MGIDMSTPRGPTMFHVVADIAEFKRGLMPVSPETIIQGCLLIVESSSSGSRMADVATRQILDGLPAYLFEYQSMP